MYNKKRKERSLPFPPRNPRPFFHAEATFDTRRKRDDWAASREFRMEIKVVGKLWEGMASLENGLATFSNFPT